ncbi:T6SS effector amidase Tae4 family protein [Superficieibacter sp. HKU1]|uniref:T6SS effector amidase Tae4 family protein n=1 Tax=Superficieibacter sp. HKU1 TaxID=3031919 RepID=UPI0023E1B6FD|nr:T6SS effector amidase Tae4 family protein [Superficieibacter sp. HKU1]WES69431.1 T6SS effector amidase Tae4 family protein [Superficieibacter sp. HKU1]
MKPSFLVLKSNHDSSYPGSLDFIASKEFYASIGYDQGKLGDQFENTCAARMSVALIKSGVKFKGRLLPIKEGKWKGRSIETGAKNLADILSQPGVFGKPEIWRDPSKFQAEPGNKRGVVFFWKIDGYDGGSGSHIDLIEPTSAGAICHSHCYFDCKKIWFWALR